MPSRHGRRRPPVLRQSMGGLARGARGRRPRDPLVAVQGGRAGASAPGGQPTGRLPPGVHQRIAGCARVRRGGQAPVRSRRVAEGVHGSRREQVGYGVARVAGRCNDRGRSPMLQYYPTFLSPSKPFGAKEMNDPRLNQLAGTLAPTGAHEGCTNGYGVYDMVGNLHEWAVATRRARFRADITSTRTGTATAAPTGPWRTISSITTTRPAFTPLRRLPRALVLTAPVVVGVQQVGCERRRDLAHNRSA